MTQMAEWSKERLSDIFEIISGGTPKTDISEYWNGDIPWLSVKDFSGDRKYVCTTEKRITKLGLDNSSTKMLKAGDIIISARGTVGEIAQLKTPMAFNQSCFGLRAKNGFHADFLYYALKHQLLSLKTVANGAVFDTITLKTFDNIYVSMPDVAIQKRIADILSPYDDLIENNNRRIQLLETAAQELYKEWFVRFRFPGHETAQFKDGLPAGWNIINIGSIFEVTSSKRVYLNDYVEQGIPFYRSKEIIQLSQGQSITEPLFISDSAFRAFSSRFGAPKENDILITSVGTIGISYLVDGHTFYFKDGNLTWIKSSERPHLAVYLYLWLNSDSGKKQLLTSTIGTSQSALTIEMLRKIKLMIPSQSELSKFYEYVMPIVKQTRMLRLKNQNLARQRDLLLPRLMSGKLEV